MEYTDFFAEMRAGSLNVFLRGLRLSFRNQRLANGVGILRLDERGRLTLAAEVEMASGFDDLPNYQPFSLIPLEDEVRFESLLSNGEVLSGGFASYSSSRDWISRHNSVTAKLTQVTVKIATVLPTSGTEFTGLIPALEEEVFDLSTLFNDSNKYFNRTRRKADWFKFDAADAQFICRATGDGDAIVSIETPFIDPAWVAQLPHAFLTAVGMNVGHRISWLCLNRRARNIDEVTLFSKAPITRSSGLLQPLKLKPRINTLVLADATQFLIDYQDSPLGTFQYTLWDSEYQGDFTLRELALGVVIEGLADFILKTFVEDLSSSLSRQIGMDKALLNTTRTRFRDRMRNQADMLREPYFGYLVRAVGSAKPYSAADKIRKSFDILCPPAVITNAHIKSWQRMRNGVAHGQSSGIDQARIDDYCRCDHLWHWLRTELIFSNPKTLSQAIRFQYQPDPDQTALAAYDLWQHRGSKSNQVTNWVDAETKLIRDHVASKKSFGFHFSAE